jgi:subtilase family serine protease
MIEKLGGLGVRIAVLMSALAFAPLAYAQITPGPSQPLIRQPINEANLVVLSGNTRPEANAVNDRGPVADNFAMEHMLLQLRRPPAQEQALTRLIEQLHDPASPDFHKWLTPDQFGARFSPAASDLARVSGWLQSHGFGINVTYASGMAIDFSGTAGQLRTAFHTQIHNLEVNGVGHIANMSDPQIPAALAPAIVGIVSLHDFRPRPGFARKTPIAAYTVGGGQFAVTPPDLATIYNFNPVFASGNTGQGQTIYLIEDSDLYTTDDWTTFRSTFGLSGYSATLETIHPAPSSGTDNCADPGVNKNSVEAILDAEYASAPVRRSSWRPARIAPPSED